jgi:dienelactone hydrolase
MPGNDPTLTLWQTAAGERYGLWGPAPAGPAPLLLILANSIEGTLGDPYFRQCGNQLAARGWLCASLDLPCHGREQRPGEAEGLAGWRQRADAGENFVAETQRRLTALLDHLVAEGRAAPGKIAVCGTSRGGFLALHFAAAEPRVSCVAAFAPVTDLLVLREFHGAERNALVPALAVSKQARRLAERPVWITIGDRDARVDTDRAIGLARAITATALARGLQPAVELHVLPEPKGHTTPRGAPEQAAAWMAQQLGAPANHS